jgi:hypothetical protein
MTILKSLAVIFCLLLASLAFSPAARADTANQRTELHFNQPVEIPGRVLPAGTYWFVLYDPGSTQSLVQIFDARDNTLCASLLTAPTTRGQEDTQAKIVFAERRHSQPEALWKWYYRGMNTGHEFIYPHAEEQHLRSDAKQVVNGLPALSTRDNSAPGL